MEWGMNEGKIEGWRLCILIQATVEILYLASVSTAVANAANGKFKMLQHDSSLKWNKLYILHYRRLSLNDSRWLHVKHCIVWKVFLCEQTNLSPPCTLRDVLWNVIPGFRRSDPLNRGKKSAEWESFLKESSTLQEHPATWCRGAIGGGIIFKSKFPTFPYRLYYQIQISMYIQLGP